MGLLNFFSKKPTPAPEIKPINNPYENKYAIAEMLKWCSYRPRPIYNDIREYPGWINYEYGISDAISFHKFLLDEKYIEAVTDTFTYLDNKRVAELKEILENDHLPAKGRKAALIQRIIDNVNIEKLNFETLYILTDKGNEYLKEYNYIFLCNSYDIEYNVYEKYKSTSHPGAKETDIIWKIFNDNYNKNYLKKDFGLARNNLLEMAQMLESEKRYTDALTYYISVMFFDLSGLDNNNDLYPVEDLDFMVAPGIVEKIVEYKDYYKIQMIDRCYKYFLPHHYLNRNQFETVIQDIFNNNLKAFKDYL